MITSDNNFTVIQSWPMQLLQLRVIIYFIFLLQKLLISFSFFLTLLNYIIILVIQLWHKSIREFNILFSISLIRWFSSTPHVRIHSAKPLFLLYKIFTTNFYTRCIIKVWKRRNISFNFISFNHKQNYFFKVVKVVH